MTLLAPTLQRLNLRDQALAAIRRALVTGQIVPGVVYSAASLATGLGVSNSPVREAMLSLVDDGLMEVVPNRGYRPVALSPSDLAEIAQLRMFLEVPAVGVAAETGVGERRPELERLVDEIEQTAAAGDVDGNLEADRQFHLAVVEVCGNRRLTQEVARLRDQARLYNLRHLAQSGALVSSAAEHRPMLAAVLAQDRTRAEQLMQAHLGHIFTDWSGGGKPAGRPGNGGSTPRRGGRPGGGRPSGGGPGGGGPGGGGAPGGGPSDGRPAGAGTRSGRGPGRPGRASHGQGRPDAK